MTGYSRSQLSEPELRDAPRIDKPVNCRELGRAVAQALEAATRSLSARLVRGLPDALPCDAGAAGSRS